MGNYNYFFTFENIIEHAGGCFNLDYQSLTTEIHPPETPIPFHVAYVYAFAFVTDNTTDPEQTTLYPPDHATVADG